MRNYLLILFLYPVLVFGQGDSITVKVPIGDPTGIAPMGTRFMTIPEPSAIRYLKINSNNSISLRTAAEHLADINAQVAGTYLAPDGNGSALTGLTKSQVGLSNADNTTDAGKPVSTAQATAIALKSTIYFGLDAGSNDTYVITASPVPASYTQGMVVIFRANTANTTGCTINVNSLGAVSILKRVSTTMATGDILSQQFCMLVYNGTAFIIMNPVVN